MASFLMTWLIVIQVPSTTATLEEDIAFLEILTGSPDLNEATKLAFLTGQTTEKSYISKNNFLTVLLIVGDVSTSRNGITLQWTTGWCRKTCWGQIFEINNIIFIVNISLKFKTSILQIYKVRIILTFFNKK